MRRLACLTLLIFSTLAWLLIALVLVRQYDPLQRASRACGQGGAGAEEGCRKALQQDPGSGPLNFHLAVALYRRGDYRQAADHFGRVLASRDRELIRDAHYNSGNCWYLLARNESDPRAAAGGYGKSLEHYARALGRDGRDGDAAWNRRAAAQGLAEALRRQSASLSPPEDGDRRKRGGAPPSETPGRGGAGERRQLDRGAPEAGGAEGLDQQRAQGGGVRPPLPSPAGAMTRQEAELLLEEARRRELDGSGPHGPARQARHRDVEKDW